YTTIADNINFIRIYRPAYSCSPLGGRGACERTNGSAHVSAQRLGGDVRLHLAQDFRRFRTLQALDVVLVLEQHAQRVVDGLGIEVERVEFGERGRPVDRLGHARRLEQVELAQL